MFLCSSDTLAVEIGFLRVWMGAEMVPRRREGGTTCETRDGSNWRAGGRSDLTAARPASSDDSFNFLALCK